MGGFLIGSVAAGVTSYYPHHFLDKERSVKWLTHFGWQLVLGRPEPGGVPWH